jgi:hypothetical protein
MELFCIDVEEDHDDEDDHNIDDNNHHHNDDSDDEHNIVRRRQSIVPLFTFSTSSLIERTEWMNHTQDECHCCKTERYHNQEIQRKVDFDQQVKEQQRMVMPEAKDGTLPALYFAPSIAIEQSNHY